MAEKPKNKREKTERVTDGKIDLLAGILARLATTETPLGVSELGREYSKNKVYIHRLLSSLESIGWVSKDPVSQRYKIGNKLISFGLLLTARFVVTKITLPYLYELSDITNETTALCIRIGYERMFVQEIPAKHVHHQTVILGQRFPLWLGATGKAMSAYLREAEIDALIDIMRQEQLIFNRGVTFNADHYRRDLKAIREQGYAITFGDYRPDVCVLAAPIFDQTNTVIGSIIVRGKAPSFDMEKAEKYSSVIVEMASKISRAIETSA